MSRIYLDDERNPRVEKFDFIVRSSKEFFDLVDTLHYVSYVSFDHDLGLDSEDGLACAKYLVEADLELGILAENFEFNVHSANPVGRDNIIAYMENYVRTKR